jgi:hypothetical protein
MFQILTSERGMVEDRSGEYSPNALLKFAAVDVEISACYADT